MTTIRLSPEAAATVARVREVRRGPLTFTIDGGCCEGTAPHLVENAIVTSAAALAGEVDGVPVYLQPAMVGPLADASLLIDVIDEPLSEAMSAETEFGLRFVIREGVCATPR